MNTRSSILALTICTLAAAHPMGNFSVSHYARLDVAPDGVDVRYVLDLAEIPTYQLLRSWNLDAGSPKADLDRRAAVQAREWVQNLEFTSGGHRLTPRVDGVDLALADGAGNVPIARITTRLHLQAAAGALSYEDRNYPDRAGWKEIVIGAGKGAVIQKASHSDADQSHALTQYPSDPTVAPPQDLRAAVEWLAEPMTAPSPATRRPPVLVPVDQPQAPIGASAPTPPPSSINAPAAPGTVVRGDYLSRMLGNRDLTLAMLLAGLIVAFALGAAHALEPGHGKTIVAAYLVGSRGTIRHALFLGGMVTFTHTISVFLLGFVTLFLSKYIVPERLFPILGAISGLSIVAIGGSLLFKRVRTLNGAAEPHHHHHHDHPHDHHHEDVPAHTHPHDAHDHHHQDHAHDHSHDHVHDHPHEHVHDHAHDQEHAHNHPHEHPHEHGHDHGPHGHSHMPEGDITLGSLIALGASGGLVPCPSALVILLSAIALGRVVLGLALLVSFSLGLALVLMAIGVMVLYAKNLLPDSGASSRHAAFRLVPVLSAAVIVCLGLLMTVVSLGWVHPGRFIG